MAKSQTLCLVSEADCKHSCTNTLASTQGTAQQVMFCRLYRLLLYQKQAYPRSSFLLVLMQGLLLTYCVAVDLGYYRRQLPYFAKLAHQNATVSDSRMSSPVFDVHCGRLHRSTTSFTAMLAPTQASQLVAHPPSPLPPHRAAHVRQQAVLAPLISPGVN